MIAQLAALSQPRRVLTVTLMMSSIFGPHTPALPAIDPRILEYHRAAAALNWHDEAAVIDYMVGGWRLLSGTAHAFDTPLITGIATNEARRANRLLSMFNHALLKGGERWWGKTGEIDVPALVIHGSDDPVLPYPHGVALADEIPNAKLLTLQGTGHELHPADWPTLTEAILDHTLKTARVEGDRR
jgi:pimeloyl-ACP methyl ester carboxylesterase